MARLAERLRGLPASVVDRVVERRHRLDTRGRVEMRELGLPEENRVWYTPSSWTTLHRVLRRIPIGPGDVFVDFGSGKGRAVVAAARYDFGRVIGVELSAELNEVARRNVERHRSALRCRDVELVTADAMEWEIPEDVTVAYFYCPFTGPIFAGVVERLIESVDRRPRSLTLIYNNPYEHNYLLGTGRFAPVAAVPASWPARRGDPANVIVTYRLVPPGAAAEVAPEAGLGPWAGPTDLSVDLPGGFESASRVR